MPGSTPGARLPEPRHLEPAVTESLKFSGLVALLFLGAGGWGTAAVAALVRAGWEEARAEIGPALQVVVGVCLFLAVGGVLVAADLARFGVLLAWHLVGVGLLVTRAGVVGGALRRLDVRAALLGLAAAGGRHRLAVLQRVRRRRRLCVPSQAPGEHRRPHRSLQREADDQLRGG